MKLAIILTLPFVSKTGKSSGNVDRANEQGGRRKMFSGCVFCAEFRDVRLELHMCV